MCEKYGINTPSEPSEPSATGKVMLAPVVWPAQPALSESSEGSEGSGDERSEVLHTLSAASTKPLSEQTGDDPLNTDHDLSAEPATKGATSTSLDELVSVAPRYTESDAIAG